MAKEISSLAGKFIELEAQELEGKILDFSKKYGDVVEDIGKENLGGVKNIIAGAQAVLGQFIARIDSACEKIEAVSESTRNDKKDDMELRNKCVMQGGKSVESRKKVKAEKGLKDEDKQAESLQQKNIFDDEPDKVAELLKELTLVRVVSDNKVIKAKIIKVDVYSQRDNASTDRYKFLLELAPGQLSFKNIFGTIIANISTKNGSCVTLNTIEIDGKVFDKPRKIAEALRLDLIQPRDKAPGIDLSDKANGQLYVE